MNYFAHGVAFLDRPYVLAGTAVPDWLLVAERQVRLRRGQVQGWLNRLGLGEQQAHSLIVHVGNIGKNVDEPAPSKQQTHSPIGQVALGILQHLADDQQFHRTPVFLELSFRLSQQVAQLLDGKVAAGCKGELLAPELSPSGNFFKEKDARPSVGQGYLVPLPSTQPSSAIDTRAGVYAAFVGHLLLELLLDAALITENPARLDQYYQALQQVDEQIVEEAVRQISARPTVRLAPMILEFRRLRILWDYLDDRKLLGRLNQVMRRVGLAELPPALLDLLPSAREQVAAKIQLLLADIPTEPPFEKKISYKTFGQFSPGIDDSPRQ